MDLYPNRFSGVSIQSRQFSSLYLNEKPKIVSVQLLDVFDSPAQC
jgi:hypothetical protein